MLCDVNWRGLHCAVVLCGVVRNVVVVVYCGAMGCGVIRCVGIWGSVVSCTTVC